MAKTKHSAHMGLLPMPATQVKGNSLLQAPRSCPLISENLYLSASWRTAEFSDPLRTSYGISSDQQMSQAKPAADHALSQRTIGLGGALTQAPHTPYTVGICPGHTPRSGGAPRSSVIASRVVNEHSVSLILFHAILYDWLTGTRGCLQGFSPGRKFFLSRSSEWPKEIPQALRASRG